MIVHSDASIRSRPAYGSRPSHIARIDEWGKFWYDWRCTGSETRSVNDTYRSVTVPAWEAATLAAGMRVGVDLAGQGEGYTIGNGGATPVPGDIVYVKNGADIVWAAGFAAP